MTVIVLLCVYVLLWLVVLSLPDPPDWLKTGRSR
jgi:hypothetical protein